MLERLFQKDEKLFFIFYDFFKIIIFFFSCYLAYKIRFQHTNELFKYINFTIIFSFLYLSISFYFREEFFFDLSIFSTIKNDMKYIFISTIIISLILYLIKTSSEYSRIWLSLFIFINLLLIVPYKIVMNLIYVKLIQSNIFLKNVLIIGNYDDCKAIFKEFRNKPHYNFRAMSLLNKTKNKDYLPIQEIELNTKLKEFLTYNKISQVWIVYNFNFDRDKIISFFQYIPIDIRTVIPKSINKDRLIDNLGNYNFYNTSLSPFFGIKYFFKIVMDFIFSFIFLLISAPIILISALLILIEDGRPIFFTQKRYGWDRNFINIYKIRTLKKNDGTFKQVLRNDNRVLKIGKYLRRFSIDELPQLYNILKGEMSLVGPRPHPIDLDNEYAQKIRGFLQRLRCKPGLTGLAQVNGYRGPTQDEKLMEKRFELDLEYLNKWNLLLDIKIIFKTLIVFLFQKVD